MIQTHWTLAETLRRHGQKVSALARASGLSKNTVYDIVNGKTQAVTLETLDKLITGLEQLTGASVTVGDVIGRAQVHETKDPALLAQLVDVPPFDLEALKTIIPHWTPEERAENERQWLAHEYDRRSRGHRREQQLDALWEELDAQDEARAHDHSDDAAHADRKGPRSA